MSVTHQPAPATETELTGRGQEFQLALESYMEGYRSAQFARHGLPPARGFTWRNQAWPWAQLPAQKASALI